MKYFMQLLGIITELIVFMSALTQLETSTNLALSKPILYVPLCIGTGYTMTGNLTSSLLATLVVVVVFQVRRSS